jgi:hypothetical protein
VLASSLAHQMSGRPQQDPIEVRCEGETDWTNLGETPNELGYVGFFYRYTAGGALTLQAGNLIELSPDVCFHLNQFALANPKPTKCPTSTQQATTVMREVARVVQRRVKVRGKWVTRRIRRSVEVPTTVTTTVPGPPAPCPLVPGTPLPADYDSYVWALWALAHESVHLSNVRDEATANCYGMQHVAWLAIQLGASPDDAKAIADYLWTHIYPQVRATNPTYWSADCYPGGPLDLTPADGVWP